MRGGQHFERGAPTVKREFQTLMRDLGKNAPSHGESALAANIHLHVIHAFAEDQVEIAQLIRLMLAAGQRQVIGLPKALISSVIVRRQRFFEPGHAILRHVTR